MAVDELTREILSKLDILAEYAELGVRIASMPRDGGFTECHAFDREDAKASAWINVETGRYGDSKENFNLSLWDFCEKYHKERFPTWIAARNHFAEKVGIEPPKPGRPKAVKAKSKEEAEKEEKKKAESTLAEIGFFEDWTPDNIAETERWIKEFKPGMTIAALFHAGAKIAWWKCELNQKTGQLERGGFRVVAVPCYGPTLDFENPQAWQFWNLYGDGFPRFNPKTGLDEPLKMRSVGWTRYTLCNLGDLRILKAGGRKGIVTKTGGLRDFLTAISHRPAELADQYLFVTNASGEKGDISGSQVSWFTGWESCTVHDADEAGIIGDRKWQAELKGKSKSHSLDLGLPYRPKKGLDLTDWFLGVPEEKVKPHSFGDLVALIHSKNVSLTQADSEAEGAAPAGSECKGASAETEAKSPAPREQINLEEELRLCRALDIEVSGDDASNAIDIFSFQTRKTTRLNSVRELCFGNLLQIGGTKVRDNVTEAEDSTEEHPFTFRQAYRAISLLAGQFRVSTLNRRGAGCWKGGTDTHPSVICVGGGGAVEWNGTNELLPIPSPHYGDRLLDFAGGGKWFNVEKLAAQLKNPDRRWIAVAFKELVDILSRWRWKQSKGAEIAAGLILATWVQTLWDWRPLVAVGGVAGSGKSKLLELLGDLFGPLTEKLSAPSTAGLRQTIGTKAAAVFVDEFEHSKHREGTIKMLRSSGRGEKITYGTTHHKPEEFFICHIVWLASIEINFVDEADVNRYIMLEMMKPEADRRNKLELPSRSVSAELGQRTLAAAILLIHEAKRIAEKLKATKVDGVQDRVIETYAAPAAMVSLCSGGGEVEAAKWLKEAIASRVEDEPSTSDDTELLRTLFSLRVEPKYGERSTIGEILIGNNTDHKKDLARSGIGDYDGPLKDADGRLFHAPGLFISQCVSDDLLKSTRWGGKSIVQLLMRVPGALKARARLGGVQRRGVWIPDEYLGRSGLLGDDESGAAATDQEKGEATEF